MSEGSKRGLVLLFALALLIRLVPIVVAVRLAGDVLRYHKLAEGVLQPAVLQGDPP